MEIDLAGIAGETQIFLIVSAAVFHSQVKLAVAARDLNIDLIAGRKHLSFNNILFPVVRTAGGDVNSMNFRCAGVGDSQRGRVQRHWVKAKSVRAARVKRCFLKNISNPLF